MDDLAAADARRFFDLWFGEGTGAQPKGYVLIWTNPGKRSTWFNNIEGAAKYAVSETTKNVYFGVSLSERDHGARCRLHSKDRPATGILGVWNDIDIAGSEHVKKNYPPDIDAALKLVEDIPTPPTITVETGGGIHCYWCLHEPWMFEDAAERVQAQALCKRWHHLVLGAAKSHGWTIDNVSDLERIMRVPGTFNVKDPKNPKAVRILSVNARARYSLEDFDSFLKEDETTVVSVERAPAISVPSSAPDEELVLNFNAEPPMLKLEVLFAKSRRAKETWEHKRKDLKDQSGSSYDMAMANFCVRAGFTMQKTTNTLIAMRRKHNDPNLPRKLRDDYYRNTYNKALATLSKSKQREEIIAQSATSDPEKGLEEFNKIVGTKFTECTLLKTDEFEYEFKHDGGEFVVPAKALLIYSAFKEVCYPYTLWRFEFLKPGQFLSAVEALNKYANRAEKITEVKGEGSKRETMRGWVEGYLTTQTPVDELDMEAYRDQTPINDGKGNILVRNDAIRKYIGRHQDEKGTVREMPSLLRSAGLEPLKHPKKVIGSNITCRFWKVTPEWRDQMETEGDEAKKIGKK